MIIGFISIIIEIIFSIVKNIIEGIQDPKSTQ